MIGAVLCGHALAQSPAGGNAASPDIRQPAIARLPVAEFPNALGKVGVIMPDRPGAKLFFDPSLSANGRSCATCHLPSDAMSLSAASAQKLWREKGPQDVLFNAVDGANCPNARSDAASSHSMLLKRGLFRIALPWPPKRRDGTVVTPEFGIEVVSDPAGCNLDPKYGLHSAQPRVSVYRRPRVAANLLLIDQDPWRLAYNFKTGKSFEADLETGKLVSMNLMSDARALTLKDQAMQALRDHMEVAHPNPATAAALADFERGIYMAQSVDRTGGSLNGPDAPEAIGPTRLPMARPLGNGDKLATPVFRSLAAWRAPPGKRKLTRQEAFRASAARGYDVFFLRPFYIRDAMGINSIGLGNPIKRTCSTCHTGEFTGNDIIMGSMDTGSVNIQTTQTDPAFYRRLSDLPLFRITCKTSAKPHPFLGREILTHDPGRALISGRCADVGALTIQQFRGLAARAPYFASGSAATLLELVDFYDTRFDMQMTRREKTDLVNFLSVL